MSQVWMDGTIVDANTASVSVFDHGLLYGDGVFEGIRCQNGYVLDLERHLDRFEHSAKAIYLSPPTREHCRSAVLDTLSALGASDAYVRLVATRGKGPLGIDVAGCNQPRLFCIAGQIALYKTHTGLALATVSLRRPDSDVLDPAVKSLNYLNNVLAKLEAKRAGADEALVLNRKGSIAEASGANVFALIEGRLCTPPVSDGALPGITRRRVLGFAKALGLEARELTLTRHDLLGAECVFLTGTGAGIVEVGSLDQIVLASRPELLDRLRALTAEYALSAGTRVPALHAAAS